MSKFARDFLSKKVKEDKRFALSIFLNSTHGPYFSAPECPKFSENRHLNSIHCADYAFFEVVSAL